MSLSHCVSWEVFKFFKFMTAKVSYLIQQTWRKNAIKHAWFNAFFDCFVTMSPRIGSILID